MLAFVFGGGGSRGALQVGAIEVLLQAGVVPDFTIGTSIGAVNAVALACDPTPAGVQLLLKHCLALSHSDIVDGGPPTALWNLVRGSRSFYTNETWQELLGRAIPVETFGELAIPAYAVATDLATGEPRVFGQNPDEKIFDALMSSTALAPVYPAWTVDGRQYIDGGVSSVLPLRHAVERGATDIVAFNLTNQLMSRGKIKNPLDMTMHMLDIIMRRQVVNEIDYVRDRTDVRLTVLELKAPYYVQTLDTTHAAELVGHGRDIAERTLPLIRQHHLEREPESRRWYQVWPRRKKRKEREPTRINDILPWTDQW